MRHVVGLSVRRFSQSPFDAQASLLGRLNEAKQFDKVRGFVETTNFPLTERSAKEYLVAMGQLGRMDNVQIGSLAKRMGYSHSSQVEAFLKQHQAMLQPPPPPPPAYSSSSLPAQQGPVEVVVNRPVYVRNFPSKFGMVLTGLGIALATFLVFRLMQGGGPNSEVMGMLKGTHQLASNVDVTLDDVVGLDEAKEEVRVLVEYLREPDKFIDFGVTMPKGLLLFGPPGVGKTHLARAMAGEANVPFFYLSASQIDEVFVGLGASRVRSLFADAKKAAPSIIFIDEIDAIGARRDFSVGAAPTQRQSLNQMLTLMDGFEEDAGVLVIAATNADEDNLDSALLRSGRFDKKVHLHLPFREDRRKLFTYYLSRMPSGSLRDLQATADFMAALTWGSSGADVANICNQAGILAVRRNSKQITLQDLQAAHADVFLGPKNLSLTMSEQEKVQTAYHEAGHVLVALNTPAAALPRQVTIVPRKNALGYMTKDVHDRVSQSREQYLAEIATAMGGRAAEEVVFGSSAVTSGAESDFAAATRIAQACVTQFGFSELGQMHLGAREKETVSDSYKELVDSAIKKLLTERYEYAREVLKQKAVEHKRLAQALLVHETLTQAQIMNVVKGLAVQ